MKKTREPFKGNPPRRMSKGLRRHLEKMARNNPDEAERQRAMVGKR